MLLVRPGALEDLDEILALAQVARAPQHCLPGGRETRAARLTARLTLSQESLRARPQAPGEEVYLFVLEDSATGRLRGTASIVASAGHAEPFYAFRNDALIHASRELKVHRSVHALSITHQLSGRSFLSGDCLDPALAGTPAASLLARARLMFMAMHRQRFAPKVFTILRGIVDDDADAVSPFWEAVGRKFFQRDFIDIELAADGRSNTFIAEIMPTYPLYVPLLPAAAQRVLSEPHPRAAAAYAMYLQEGFQTDGFVDIFDAGPVLTALVDLCATVRHGALHPVACLPEAAACRAGPGTPYLLANESAEQFRCVLADLAESPGAADPLVLAESVAAQLALGPGDPVCCVPLNLAECLGEAPR